MTNEELQNRLTHLCRAERKITLEILNLINLAMERRIFLELGYPSMFEWLVKEFGYSNAAAYRRIESARLLKAVPEISEKLEEGKINLSTLAKVQNIIRVHEKQSKEKVSAQIKKDLVQEIELKTIIETEQIMVQKFPAAASTVYQERKCVIDHNQVRHHMNLSNKTIADLKRAKEVLSHKFPEPTDADIISYALQFMLEKVDPLRKNLKGQEPQLALL